MVDNENAKRQGLYHCVGGGSQLSIDHLSTGYYAPTKCVPLRSLPRNSLHQVSKK